MVPFYYYYIFRAFFFLFGLSLFYLGQCSINDDDHTSIYLQLNDYNSILEESMTLYECLRQCTGKGNESRVTCMENYESVALPQIRCQLHDHAWQYDNDEVCHSKLNGGKLHDNISRNGYGNAIIGRYGGCFEEDISRFMCDRAYRITGFGCTGEVCTNSQGEKGQCTVPKRLAMMEG